MAGVLRTSPVLESDRMYATADQPRIWNPIG